MGDWRGGSFLFSLHQSEAAGREGRVVISRGLSRNGKTLVFSCQDGVTQRNTGQVNPSDACLLSPYPIRGWTLSRGESKGQCLASVFYYYYYCACNCVDDGKDGPPHIFGGQMTTLWIHFFYFVITSTWILGIKHGYEASAFTP